MTPKEKAKELVDKMMFIYNIDDIAIDCALIAVDEILNITYQQDELIWLDDYYREVKTEILNL